MLQTGAKYLTLCVSLELTHCWTLPLNWKRKTFPRVQRRSDSSTWMPNGLIKDYLSPCGQRYLRPSPAWISQKTEQYRVPDGTKPYGILSLFMRSDGWGTVVSTPKLSVKLLRTHVPPQHKIFIHQFWKISLVQGSQSWLRGTKLVSFTERDNFHL